MATKLTLPEVNALCDRLASLEFFWKLENRFAMLKEAGLVRLIPTMNLEVSPSIAASHIIRGLADRGDEGLNRFIAVMDQHPNP